MSTRVTLTTGSIDVSDLIQFRRETINGIECEVGPSPYFIPEKVSTGWDENKLVIKLHYISDEKTLAQRAHTRVMLHLGVHTKRVFGIEADRVGDGERGLINRALEELGTENADLVRKALMKII